MLTPKEKDEVTQLVDTMLGFGISYRHPKQGMLKANYGMEGQSALALDPPIDALVKFKVIFFFPMLCRNVQRRHVVPLCSFRVYAQVVYAREGLDGTFRVLFLKCFALLGANSSENLVAFFV